MAISMATMKVTVTLEEEQVEDIRDLVEAGKADSVSGFVQHAVDIALSDAAGWKRMLDEALDRTGGPPTAAERAWIESLLGPAKGRKRRRQA
ncbi:MAG: toxin-antitoxin system antitoxin subunit [Acidobacteria bacterium]|nr:toxin-antitoxin system antitoxin subunit [Acidobacteriota bacterium]